MNFIKIIVSVIRKGNWLGATRASGLHAVAFMGTVFSLICAAEADGYTYLAGGKGLRLGDGGVITFYRSSEVPRVDDVEGFEGGAYAGFSDEQIYDAFLRRAAEQWNAVPGKTYTIEISDERVEERNENDGRNVITLFLPSDNKKGGDATPILDGGKSYISDCDIRVGRSAGIEELGIILAHEMGHCLGLGHEQKELKAIMSYNRNAFKLTLDDAAGAASIYPVETTASNSNFRPCGSVALPPRDAGRQRLSRLFMLFLLLAPVALSLLSKASPRRACSKE